MAKEAIQRPLFNEDPTEERRAEIRQAVLRMLPDQEVDQGPEEPKTEVKEAIEVHGIRPVQPKDYYRILQWFSDPETQGHLDPLPKLPEDWSDENQVAEAFLSLAKYYENVDPKTGAPEPEKITALVAVNEKDKALGVTTIRWRGDPWLPKGHKIASIERLIVNPRIRGKGVGTKLAEEALRMIFEERDFPEVRAWVMSDEKAGHWEDNFHFFRKFEFIVMPGAKTWREYAQARDLGENAENRDAIWLQLKKEKWESLRQKSPSPTPQLL